MECTLLFGHGDLFEIFGAYDLELSRLGINMSFLITEIVGANSVINILCALAGFIFGGILAWVMAARGVEKKWGLKLEATDRRANTAEGKIIGLESTVAELRTQNQRDSESLENIRSKLELEQNARVKAETQLVETVQRLREEKKLLEEA